MAFTKISNINDEVDFNLFLIIAKRNLLYVFIFIILFLASAFLYLRWTYPLYEASSIIQLDMENQAQKVFKSDLYDNDIASKIELLRSSMFIKRIVDKLPLSVSYFNKGRILDYELYKNTPFNADVIVTNPRIYDIPIYIKFLSHDKFELNYTIGKSIIHSQTCFVGQKCDFTDFSLKISVDYFSIKEDIKFLTSNKYFFVINNPSNIIKKYTSQLRISVSSELAKTIKVNFQDRNPIKAADFVNTIADEFIIYDIEKKAESSNKILDYINKQLEIFSGKLYESENELDVFKQKNRLNSADKPLPNFFSRISDIENQVLQIELEEDKLITIQDNIAKSSNIDIYKMIAILADSQFQGVISNSLNTLQQLLLEKEQLLYQYTESSGQVDAVKYKIEIQKKLLSESISTILKNVQNRKKELQKKVDSFKKIVFTDSSEYNTIEYSKLSRIYSINEKYFNQLIDQKAEYSIAKAGYVSQNLIFEKSQIPISPIFPIRKIIYLGCLIAAILVSFIMIFIKYLLYDEIKSINDLSKHTNIPILGLIPKFFKPIPVSQLIVNDNPRSLIAEGLRIIRSNLQFISNEPGPKVIAVTSTISGEGKTFFAINLGGILAMSDKKVIILDFDMRKPKIHHGFGVNNVKGISTLLASRDLIDNCINKSNFDNIDFITAGPIPPNPSELILSEKMDELIAYLKTKYDFIIIDNPPIGLVTDGIKSIQLSDYPIYIFKVNYSKRQFISNAEHLMNENNIKKLSIVLNATIPEYSSYGYSNYYSTQYGYGYYENEDINNEYFFKKMLKKLKQIFRKKNKN